MASSDKTIISIDTFINAPVEKVWTLWTGPEHIAQWNAASDDWHTTKVENDLTVGGVFSSRMEAKDGSFGFDFSGKYTAIETNKLIAYVLGDERTVTIIFETIGDQTKVVEEFEAESTNPVEMQKGGWQSILNNFKKYVERN